MKSIDFHSQMNKSPCLSIEKEFLFSDFSQKRAIDKSIEKFLEPWFSSEHSLLWHFWSNILFLTFWPDSSWGGLKLDCKSRWHNLRKLRTFSKTVSIPSVVKRPLTIFCRNKRKDYSRLRTVRFFCWEKSILFAN